MNFVPFHLLHIDLFGQVSIEQYEVLYDQKVKKLISDHHIKFCNVIRESFCDEKVIV